VSRGCDETAAPPAPCIRHVGQTEGTTNLRNVILGCTAVVALFLAACGNDEQPSTADEGTAPTSTATGQQATHNDADVAFAQRMVPHHQQAVEMAELAASRGSTDTVKDLANRIKGAQDPEIQQMNGWLAQWGATSTSPPTGMDHGSTGTSAPGMDHGSGPGMMTDAEMRDLEQASGVDFDRMFLEMMIRHHQGAVEEATTEVAKGANPDAKALAQRIIDTQQAEIAEMQEMLGSL
jgi:uncharacterized protein (DUF305 family)